MGKFMFPGINVPPEDFLHAFFDVHEKVCLRVFSDQPGSAFSGLKTDCVLEGFSDVADLLKTHNDQKRGIFFVVNHGGHEDSTINRINAHFCEIDDVPIEEQLEHSKHFAVVGAPFTEDDRLKGPTELAEEALLKKALGTDTLPIQVLPDRIAFPWFVSTEFLSS